MHLPGDMRPVSFLPDRKVFLSGKARIWHVCILFLPFCSLSVLEREFLYGIAKQSSKREGFDAPSFYKRYCEAIIQKGRVRCPELL